MLPDAATPFIRFENIHKHFVMGRQTVHALKGVNLTIRPGEFVVLMGPSGSGKSTLLNLLGGLDRPDDGRILVEGDDITRFDQDTLCHYRRCRIGFVFQSFNLLATMTAQENVEFPLIFAGVDLVERQARAEKGLATVGLAHRRRHRPTELSGGEQQRVAIARALINDPALVLADEPTGNLDSHIGREVMEVLAQVNRQGRTLVVVTHDERVSAYADRVIHMMDGALVLEASNAN